MQKREALPAQKMTEPGNAGNVLFRPAQAGDDSGLYGVGSVGENDRNGFCRCFGCKCGRTSAGCKDDRGVKIINQVRRQHRQSIFLALGPAESDVDITALAIANLR